MQVIDLHYLTIRPLESNWSMDVDELASFEYHHIVDSNLHTEILVGLGGETAAKVLNDHHMIGRTIKLP